MNIFTVDLYAHFRQSRGAAAAGNLTGYVMDAPENIRPERRRPAILILPGGGYRYTSARECEPIALRYLAKGYVAFVLRYSCAPSRFPVALRESAMAMRYIRENAAQLGVNPAMIAAIGFSAGGHLCGTLGTMYDAPEVQDLGDAALLRPDALCLSYPVAVSWGRTHEGSFINLIGDSDPQLRARLSLDALARPDMPPVFLWHTRDDGSVPVRNCLVLAQALDEKGVRFAMNIYAHGQHGISIADDQVYPAHEIPEHSACLNRWLDDCLDFFRENGFHTSDQ